MAAAEFQELIHALKALEPKQKVVYERNPQNYCSDCGAEDRYGDFHYDLRNGNEIAFCRNCR